MLLASHISTATIRDTCGTTAGGDERGAIELAGRCAAAAASAPAPRRRLIRSVAQHRLLLDSPASPCLLALPDLPDICAKERSRGMKASCVRL